MLDFPDQAYHKLHKTARIQWLPVASKFEEEQTRKILQIKEKSEAYMSRKCDFRIVAITNLHCSIFFVIKYAPLDSFLEISHIMWVYTYKLCFTFCYSKM